MQKLIDITLPISPEMVVWPGAPKTEFSWRRSMERGERNNNSNFFMNSHSGTHVDAPLHFLKNGDSIETMPLEILIGRTFVADLSDKEKILIDDLEKRWPESTIERVLFKTRRAPGRLQTFDEAFCALEEEETRWLLEKGIRLIGIDSPSIQKFGASPIVHQLLLTAGVVVIEGLDLAPVAQGFYELICLPLKLKGLEGSPARVVLRYDDSK